MEANETLQGVGRWPAATKTYFEELRAEMKRVTWPTRQQVISTTGVVIAAVFLFAAYFALVDELVGRLVTRLFDSLGR